MGDIMGDTARELLLTLVLADFHPTTGTKDMYMALFLDRTEDDGSGTEVSGTDYDRVLLDYNDWTVTAEGATYDADLEFPTVGVGGWGQITHWGVMDDPTGGDVVLWGNFGGGIPDEVEEGATVSVPGGTLTYAFRASAVETV